MPRLSAESWKRQRESVARRSREQTRKVQEIAPLPPIKNPERRKACRNDLRAFCLEYFPKRFELEFSSNHLKIIERLEEMFCRDGNSKLSVAAPRGSGKTSLTETSLIWAFVYGHCRYIVVVAANNRLATGILNNIKRALTQNKALREDFPESVYPFYKLGGSALLARGQQYLGELTGIEWKSDSIVFATIPEAKSSGAILYSVGLKGAVRGNNRTMPDGETIARPNLVVLDDPQTEAAARSPKQIDVLSGIIDRSMAGLVGPADEIKMILLCTVIEENDLSSRYLDHNQKPQWKGLRFKMVEQMPTNMKLWEQYRDLRREDAKKATQFYEKNLAAMREGAVVPWEENYTKKEVDALQHAMNIWADNETTFYNEYQNEPMRPDSGEMVVTAKVIRTRLNGLDHHTLPLDAPTLTGFIDVHDDLLYYAVVAWADDFTGYVVDYGTYPKQTRRVFKKGETGLKTMSRGDQRKDGLIQTGLVQLIKDLLATHWDVEGDRDGAEHVTISKLLIDTGYKPQIVENAIRLAVGRSTVVVPAKGKSIRASMVPMCDWKQKSGERFGNHWIESTPSGRLRTITVDVNFWKCQVHDAFRMLPGNRGSLTLFGRDPEVHRMFSEHMNGEVAKLTESGGNTVYEWQDTPNDNHFFDCMVGNMVAASVLGIKSAEERVKPKRNRSPV